MEFDLVMRNGTIVEGAGRPRFRGDQGLCEGRHLLDAEGVPRWRSW